jgi:hypothetical protein
MVILVMRMTSRRRKSMNTADLRRRGGAMAQVRRRTQWWLGGVAGALVLVVDAAGFATLAHKLVHVLQYRREGFADFICHYWPACGIAAELSGDAGVSCEFEQQAYMHQALVQEDVHREGDGIFTCALDAHAWNGDKVSDHTCAGKELLDNCPDVASSDQADADGDGSGDVCDPGHACISGDTRYEACPAQFWGSGYSYVCTYGYWHRSGGCRPIPPGGSEP